MTITQELSYLAPGTLAEVVQALESSGSRARVLAGGTDLVAWLRDQTVDLDVLIDLKRVEELRHLDADGDHLRIGALTTFTDLLDSPTVRRHVPLVAEMAGMVASVGIRNRATIVGNVCSAVPSCDAGPVLLALDAELHVTGPDGNRIVPIGDWFLGPRSTALKPSELVTGVSIPIPDLPHGAAFARLTRYRGEDLAQASVAVIAHGNGEFRVAFGALAATPFRSLEIERVLAQAVDEHDLAALALPLVRPAITPITDLRATEEYRAAMAEVMLERALRAALDRREGTGLPYGTHLI